MPASAELVVFNSGIAHNHSKGDYRTRRAECETAARRLEVSQLRDLDVRDLPRIMDLPEPLGRRARHVVTEDARVLDAVVALRKEDVEALGRLFYASHESMRDDYEVSVPEIDLVVDLARALTGCLRSPPDGRWLRRFGGHADQAGDRPGRGARGFGRLRGEDGQNWRRPGAADGERMTVGGMR